MNEILTVLEDLGAATIAVGSSRDPVQRSLAAAVAGEWTCRGGVVLTVLDWPSTAASWLRQARRFTAGSPDAWVVCAAPSDFTGMRQRLLAEGDWDPRRTAWSRTSSMVN